MCNLYTWKMTAEEMRALKLHFQLIGTTWTEWEERQRGQNEPIKDVYPNRRAPVVTLENGQHVVREDMLWGFPPPPFVKSKAPVTNVRHVAKGYWKGWLGPEHRCIVPAIAFSEFDQDLRVPRWFKRADGLPFFFAGIWRPWTGDRGTKAKPDIGDHLLFSFLTTEPNAVVAPIHPKAMPVLLLDAAAIERWLTASNDNALELQQPAPDDALVLLPAEKKAA